MADNDVQINFGGDASGVKAAAGDAAAALASVMSALDPVLKALDQFQKQVAAAFKPPATDGVKAAADQAASAGAGAAKAYADLAQVIAAANGAQLTAAQALTAALELETGKRDAADTKSAQAMNRRWNQAITPIVSRFGQGMLQMAEGTKSFGQVMTSVGQEILTKWVQNISKKVSAWLEGEMTQTAATQTGNQLRTAADQTGSLQSRAFSLLTAEKDIMNSAARAAASAFNAFASNPLTLPFAPVAAAATFTAVEAFGNLTSAAGGYDIPSGVNPLVQAHAEEMILPARIANPLRSVLANVSGPQAAASTREGGGAVHFTAQVSALDAKGVQQFFDKHSDHLVRTLRGAHRRGALTGVFG